MKIWNDPESKVVSIQNAFIKKVTEECMGSFVSEKQILNKEVFKFLNDLTETCPKFLYKTSEKDKEDMNLFLKHNPIAIKYGIKYGRQEYNRDNKNYKRILNISVDVNSYDLNKPKVPYPESISIDTGDLIHLLCENEKGDEFYAITWG